MAYLIFTRDRADAHGVRDANRAAHFRYLREHQHLLIASGGIQDEAGRYAGGAILLDVDSLEAAEAFAAGDPFTHADLFAEVVISRWVQAFKDGREDFRPPSKT